VVEDIEVLSIILIIFKAWDLMLYGFLLLLITEMEGIMDIGAEIFIV